MPTLSLLQGSGIDLNLPLTAHIYPLHPEVAKEAENTKLGLGRKLNLEACRAMTKGKPITRMNNVVSPMTLISIMESQGEWKAVCDHPCNGTLLSNEKDMLRIQAIALS